MSYTANILSAVRAEAEKQAQSTRPMKASKRKQMFRLINLLSVAMHGSGSPNYVQGWNVRNRGV